MKPKIKQNIDDLFQLSAQITNEKANTADLETEIEERQNANNDMQSQVNQIVLQGTSGDSTAEVAQARGNILGKVFQTVHGRVSDIENYVKNNNYVFPAALWENKTFNTSTKAASSATTIILSSLTKVEVGAKINIPAIGGCEARIHSFKTANYNDYIASTAFAAGAIEFYTYSAYIAIEIHDISSNPLSTDIGNNTNIVVTKPGADSDYNSGYVDVACSLSVGSFNATDDLASTTRIRSNKIKSKIDGTIRVTAPTNFRISSYRWSQMGESLYFGWSTSNTAEYTISKGETIRFLFKQINDVALSDGVFASIKIKEKPSYKSVTCFPELSTVISDMDMLMAHDCNLYPDPSDLGVFWGVYYYNKYQSEEDRTHEHTGVQLVKFNIINPSIVERFNILNTGETLNGFTQGVLGVYEPNIYVDSNNVYVYMLCNDGTDRHKVAVFNKATKTITSLQNVTLDGTALTGTTSFVCSIVKDGVGDLYTGLSKHTIGDNGKIIKSTNGIAWTTYATFPVVDAAGYSVELSICFDQTNANILCLNRIQTGAVPGIYYGRYNIVGTQWSVPYIISDADVSKPQIIRYNNSIIGMYQLTDYYGIATDWKNNQVPRSGLNVVSIESDVLSSIGKIYSESSIQYPACINYKGSMYMAFTEDRRKISNDCKTNISFMPVIIR